MMNNSRFNLQYLTNDQLESLTDHITDLLDEMKLLLDKHPALVPSDIINDLIELEAECCIQLDLRGLTIMPDMDIETKTYAPEAYVWQKDPCEPDPAALAPFANFIDGIDFDSPSPWGEGDTGGEGS